MMEVPVTLVRMRRQEGTRCRFGLFQEVRGAIREWEDMVVLHIASSVPKHTRRANAEVSPLKFGEMPLQIILIAQSHSYMCFTTLCSAHLRTSQADAGLLKETRIPE